MKTALSHVTMSLYVLLEALAFPYPLRNVSTCVSARVIFLSPRAFSEGLKKMKNGAVLLIFFPEMPSMPTYLFFALARSVK